MEDHLSVKEIHERLSGLQGWEMGFDSIHKNFEFDDFKHAIEFVNKVAHESDKMNHHPEIKISYNIVSLNLTTQDSGGITHKDFKLAKVIEQIF